MAFRPLNDVLQQNRAFRPGVYSVTCNAGGPVKARSYCSQLETKLCPVHRGLIAMSGRYAKARGLLLKTQMAHFEWGTTPRR